MQLCACRVRPYERSLSQMSLLVFVAFCVLCDICHFCRAGMSCRVNVYSLSGGGSIGTLPGVVPAAWGGPWRARRAVRAAPKTRNYTSTRVKNVVRVSFHFPDRQSHSLPAPAFRRAALLCEGTRKQTCVCVVSFIHPREDGHTLPRSSTRVRDSTASRTNARARALGGKCSR